MLHAAFALYLVNVVAGLAAQARLVRLGRAHHVLYALVFASAGAALWVERDPWLCLTLGALALFPRARPRTWAHPTLAGLGLLGYCLAYLQ